MLFYYTMQKAPTRVKYHKLTVKQSQHKVCTTKHIGMLTFVNGHLTKSTAEVDGIAIRFAGFWS